MTRHTSAAAPLDRAALERVLLPFGPSRLLPQEAYTSQDVLDWERTHLFEGSWTCAGTTFELQRPGDQHAVRVGRDGILLVRGEDGTLRGFYNVCRHRAHELLPPDGCRSARSIRCPYHGWTYGLDGALRHGSDQEGFDPAREGLIEARVQEWGAWVFVNASGDAPPFADWIGTLEGLCRGYETGRLRVGAEHVYEIPANWKLVVENYDECYHCPQIHPQLCKVSPPESGDNPEHRGAFVGGHMDLVPHAVTMSMDGHSDGLPLRGLGPEQLRQVLYFSVFPNLLLSLHPDYVMTHRMEPLSPSRTRIECQWLFPPEALEKPGFDPRYAVEFWDVTNKQDWSAVESVQRGIESRGYRPGTLHSQEDAVYQFVSRVAQAYIDGRFDPIPRMPVPGSRA
jgi:Rieske 2Fe-2S family protein